MFLATEAPRAKFDGERIILTVPSGNSSEQIAMTVHEAMSMAHGVLRAASGAISEANMGAEIIAFRRRA